MVHRIPRIRNVRNKRGMEGYGKCRTQNVWKTGFYVVNFSEKGKHSILLSKNF